MSTIGTVDALDARDRAGGTWIGRSVARLDGHRYVAGQVRYSADLLPGGCLFVALVRSPHACARVLGIDAGAARAMPGVVAVLDGTEAERLCAPMPQVLPFRHPDAARLVIGRCLAADAARFAGQPVAAVVAESQQSADAAADRVAVRYEPLGAVLHAHDALTDGAPVVHPGWTSTAAPMETLCYIGDWEERTGRLTLTAPSRTRTPAAGSWPPRSA